MFMEMKEFINVGVHYELDGKRGSLCGKEPNLDFTIELDLHDDPLNQSLKITSVCESNDNEILLEFGIESLREIQKLINSSLLAFDKIKNEK